MNYTASRLGISGLVLIFGIALSLLISSFQIQSILADNIDEGFESSLDGRYVHHGDNATFTHVNNSAEAHMGNRSLKITSSNSDPAWSQISELTRWMTPIQAYTVSPGETVTAEVWMRGEDIKDRANLSLTFFQNNTTGNWSEAWVRSANSSVNLSGTTGWTKLSVTYESPSDAVYVRPEFRLFDTGTLYIDSFKFNIESDDDPSEFNENISVHETVGMEGSQFGAQVIMGEKEFIWVTPDCKQQLIDDGHEVTVLTWPQLDDNYEQLTTNSLSCEQVRTFDASTQTNPVSGGPALPGVPGSIEVIGPTPPAGGVNQDPEELTEFGYDTSVIPFDELITTRIHGINRHHEKQLFTIDCGHSHYANDDPIVFPGNHGGSHSHEFFGDTQVNASSTTQSILDNPGNTCGVQSDRSAYWTPTAYQDGEALVGNNNKFYYKAGPVDPSLIVDMPVGLRMIAGNANATGPQSTQVTYYFASRGEGKLTSPATQNSKGRTSMFTTRPDEKGIRAKINFPQCWDGEHLWLPNSSHMAYPINTGKKYHECPATHPKPIVRIKYNIGYTGATGGEGFKLSSGEWYTMHADFINGWKPEVLKNLTDACIRGKRYCSLVQNVDQCKDIRSGRTTTAACVTLTPDEPDAVITGATEFPECHIVQDQCL